MNMTYLVDSVQNVVGHRYVNIIETGVNVSIVPFQIKTIRNFVKYNDYMDKFRNTDSWRDLLPELAEVIEKRL